MATRSPTARTSPVDNAVDAVPADAAAAAAPEGGPGARTDGGSRDAATTGDAGPVTPADPPQDAYELDCGDSAIVLEAAGDPKNRVNYVIVIELLVGASVMLGGVGFVLWEWRRRRRAVVDAHQISPGRPPLAS